MFSTKQRTTIWVDEEVWKEFHTQCLAKGVTMSSAIRDLICESLEQWRKEDNSGSFPGAHETQIKTRV